MTDNAGDGPWYPAIHANLTGIALALPQRPAWYEQWLQLGPQSSDEQRLRIYQAIRDAGVLPADAGFHLVTWHIDAMSDSAVETELRALVCGRWDSGPKHRRSSTRCGGSSVRRVCERLLQTRRPGRPSRKSIHHQLLWSRNPWRNRTTATNQPTTRTIGISSCWRKTSTEAGPPSPATCAGFTNI